MQNDEFKLKVCIPSNGQTVSFINIFNGEYYEKNNFKTKLEYADVGTGESFCDPVALLNYQDFKENNFNVQKEEGICYGGWGIPESANISVFKQEVDNEGNPLTPLELVSETLNDYSFMDANISNRRKYKYYVYFNGYEEKNDITKNIIYRKVFTISTNWQQWSLTELHPTDNTMKSFTISPKDVWLFNLNLESGAQTQNLSKSEINTLGRYAKISQGRGDYLKGNISCLLGNDVIPAYLATEFGYNETRRFPETITSNQRVDMLREWRKFVKSSNPKLLKDREGQSFLVTLFDASNKPYDNVKLQPNTISFSWTEIGSLDGVTIVGAAISKSQF